MKKTQSLRDMVRRILRYAPVLLAGAVAFSFSPAGADRVPADRTSMVEDLVPVPGGKWLIGGHFAGLGNAPGGLYAFDIVTGRHTPLTFAKGRGSKDCPALDPAQFSAHGLDLHRKADGTLLLRVVNHLGRESIENFAVDVRPSGLRLRWLNCILTPGGAPANSLVSLSDDSFLATIMYDPAFPDAMARTIKGEELGRIVKWSADGKWTVVRDRLSGANGILVSPDRQYAYASLWGQSRLIRVPLTPTGTERTLDLPYRPDNLRWARDGAFLSTGQPGQIETVVACVMGKATCSPLVPIAQIDAASFAATKVENLDAGAPVAPTAALQVGNTVWVASLAGEGVHRLPRPAN